jgi:hypothetical protein
VRWPRRETSPFSIASAFHSTVHVIASNGSLLRPRVPGLHGNTGEGRRKPQPRAATNRPSVEEAARVGRTRATREPEAFEPEAFIVPPPDRPSAEVRQAITANSMDPLVRSGKKSAFFEMVRNWAHSSVG